MGLSDNLQKRINQTRNAKANIQDLPAEFNSRLTAFLSRSRANTIYSNFKRKHYLQIDLAPGKMEAYASVYLDSSSPELTHDEIHIALSTAGVNYGLTMKQLASRSSGSLIKQSFVGIVVSIGDKPIPGKAGYVDLLKRVFDPGTPNDLANFTPVVANEIIATVHPPVKGIPGSNVLGEEELPQQESHESYKLNKLIKSLNTGDKISLIALSNGHLRMRHNELILRKELTIGGEVTVGRGPLNYNDDVNINSNINENTSMQIDGNLYIAGMVSSCQMKVSGNIQIQQGIFGQAKAIIDVSKNLSSRYINETEVNCKQSVYVGKEIMNSQMWVQDRLEAAGAVLVGGYSFSLNGLTVGSIGSELGLPTLVCVGLDYNEYRIKNELEPALEDLELQLNEALEKSKIATGPNREVLAKHIRNLMGEIEQRKNEIKYMSEHLLAANERATIRVTDAIFPGTNLMIGFTEFNVKEKIKGPIEVSLEDEKLSFKPFQIK